MPSSTFVVPLDSALKWTFGGWSIAIWFNGDPGFGIGDQLLLGHGTDDAGYVSDAVLAGPDTNMGGTITNAGGLGNFLVALLPKINAELKTLYNKLPPYPAETNATPYTVDSGNIALYEYFTPVMSANGNYETIAVKSYTPPPP